MCSEIVNIVESKKREGKGGIVKQVGGGRECGDGRET